MSKDILTFYNYIRHCNTNLTKLFLEYLGDLVMDKLPYNVCSSKIIYNILRQDLNTYYKQKLFYNTYMEYFKWKILYSKN